jgi:hypothetical protein
MPGAGRPYPGKCESENMVSIRNQNGNAEAEKMIEKFSDVLRRKKLTVEHLEAALSRYLQRQELTDLVPRFRQVEVNHG